MGDAFCYFPLYAVSRFFFVMRMKLGEAAWGKDAPLFDRKARPFGGIFDSFVPQYRGVSFSNGWWLVSNNLSYFKYYRHWKNINIIQTLCPSQDRQCPKSGGPGGKSGRSL